MSYDARLDDDLRNPGARRLNNGRPEIVAARDIPAQHARSERAPGVTSSTEPDAAPRRGRPRSETTRTAIVKAAGELLLEYGLSSVSMDAVAERAGASKATIYRWWPSKELLALDALFSQWNPGPPETQDTGSLAGDLHALIRPWARRLAKKPYGRIIAALMSSAQSDPLFAEEYRARFVHQRREPGRIILARAVDRGEIPPDIDIEAILDLLYGAFYLRILNGHAPLDARFARTVVDYIIGGLVGPSELATSSAPPGNGARPGRRRAPARSS